MNRFVAAVGALALCAGMAHAQSAKALRYVPNTAYGLGEKFTFDVSYGFITAGEATMAIDPQIAVMADRPCFHVRFDVASKQSLEWLYRVHDHYDTYIDIDGIFPWKFEQHVREGGYSRDFSADFDQVKNIANTSENRSLPIAPFSHDILSAYYGVRALDLKSMRKGDQVILQNFYKDHSNELVVRILGRQQVEVPAGTFNCVVIEPLVKEGGLFKSEGRILIWLSDDDRKIPVKVSTKVVIGAIDAELTSYSGTRGPIDGKVN
jgi:hypothetical protein